MMPELIHKKISELLMKQKINPNHNLLQELKSETPALRTRIISELSGLGPLDELLLDPAITEILANGPNEIFFEKAGRLQQHPDAFFSEQSYAAVLDRLAQSCNTCLNREKPFVEAQLENRRITLLFGEIARDQTLLSIRVQPRTQRSLEDFFKMGWCSQKQLSLLRNIFQLRANFLVVGGTSSGKTSVLQSLLQLSEPFERIVLIEDTREIMPPNSCSVSLLTRQDPARSVPDVSMEDLLKRALRLRPDRLVVGEIRGGEATSLLMALSTGHDGSFGSLHARSAPEALLRLEMLIQMGAPQWNLLSVRKLIAMSLQYIVVLEKKCGKRILKGIYEIKSLEENGLTLHQLDEGENSDYV